MDGSVIQLYDVFMLAILVLAAVFGAWKGMAWQLASVTSLVLSFLVASRCSGWIAAQSDKPWNRVLTMLILFVATSAAVWFAFRLVAGAIDKVKMKDFDRQLGALLGAVKGGLLCLVITFFAVTLSEAARQKVLQSRSGYYIAVLIDRTGPVLPEGLRGVLGKYIDELDRKLDPNTPPEKPDRPLSAQAERSGGLPTGDTPLSSSLGVDKIERELDAAGQGIEGVRRSLDDFGRDVGAVRDDLDRAGETIGGQLDAARDRVGDLRSSFEGAAGSRR